MDAELVMSHPCLHRGTTAMEWNGMRKGLYIGTPICGTSLHKKITATTAHSVNIDLINTE